MKKKIIYLSVLAVCLLLSRIIDYSIYSVLAKEEYKHYQTEKDIHHEYIGLSTYETAKSILLENKISMKNKFVVIAFFDLIHPARFVVFNKGDKGYIYLLANYIEIETGLTEISYYKSNRVRINSSGNIRWEYSTVMCSLYHYIFGKSVSNSDGSFAHFVHNRFEIYSLATEPWLKKIYIVYFYLPLILLLVFYRKYNIKLAFSYFLIMPILFFPKHFIFDSVFCNFFDDRYSPIFGDNPVVIKVVFLSIFLALWYLILKNIILGIIDLIKRKNKTDLKEKLIILYFLILPIILRF